MTTVSRWNRVRRRVRYWLEHDNRRRLLREEMDFHVESLAQELVEQGLSKREALAAARRRFGNMTRTAEDARSAWIAQWVSDAAQDLRYAFRGMRRNAGFATLVILIAGIGIGASSTIFSVVNALLLRPLPFSDAGRLVWVSNDNGNGEEYTLQVDHVLDLRDRNRSFSDLAGWFGGYNAGGTMLTGAGEPERLTSVPVTQNFFPLLGVQPFIGRSFTVEECQGRFRAPSAALLSFRLWQRRFASDPRAVGRTLTLDGAPVTVVGILPASFDFGGVFAPGMAIDLFIPWPLTAETNRRGNTTKVIGRLQPGATLQAAQTELALLAREIEHEHPERNSIVPKLSTLERHVSGRIRPAVIVLACAVGVVMLIVCANLTNLQLARMTSRQKEMAVRAALGAGRQRLLRQMLTESVAIACCGAAFGLAFAVAGTRALAHLSAFNIPLLGSVGIDARALGFTLLATVVTGVLFGLLPAIQASGIAVQDALRQQSRGSSTGRAHAWLRSGLVITQIAFACALLIGAGLLIRSFLRVLDVQLGFQPERAAALRIDPSVRFSGFPEQNVYFDELLRRARAIPGIVAAGTTDLLPLTSDRSWMVGAKGQVYPKGQAPEAFIHVVSDGYFEAAQIPLRAGRLFTEADRATSDAVTIVNETLARRLWPGQDAIGQTMTQDGGRRVVGVVGDVRHRALEEGGGPELYLPLRQTSDYAAVQLVVRTSLSPDGLASAIRIALAPVDPNLPVRGIQTLQGLVDTAASPRRFIVALLAGFAGFALLLASLGIYGVISYSVSQRVQEIGIRMALGASASNLQGGILLHTLGLAAAGLAIGMTASRILTGAMGRLLFGVTAGDPATYAAIGALLLAVAAAAGYAPARRASRIDPLSALRSN